MEPPTHWHTLPTPAVFRHLRSTPLGLAQSERANRQAQYGPNELLAATRSSPWAMLFEQLRNILVLILLAATLLSAFLGHGEASRGAATASGGGCAERATLARVGALTTVARRCVTACTWTCA